MSVLKFFLSNLLFRRSSNSIKWIPYLGTHAYLFENQKDADKLKKGVYAEMPELRFFQDNFDKNDVFIDIGSNMGLFSILAANHVDKVIAFEPIKLNSALIRLSLAAKNIENVKIYENAVSDVDGESTFIQVAQSSLSMCSPGNDKEAVDFIKNEYGEKTLQLTKVAAVKLDSFSLNKVNLIKIDVEGMELKVVKGAKRTIKRCQPRLIMIEIFARAMALHKQSAEELFSVMSELGYTPFILKDQNLEKFSDQKIPNDNIFFCKNGCKV